jgi:tetratricopeptide (TPR) repeat protein
MQRILFIILFNVFGIWSVYSQNIHQIKSFSDEQYEKGNYAIALKEYQRVQLFDTENLYADIFYKVASIYYLQNNFEKAIEYFNFAWRTEPGDSIKTEIALKKAFCNFKQSNYFAALNELFDIPETNSRYLDSKKNLYFAISYFGLNDMESSNYYFSQIVKPGTQSEITQVFTDFIRFKKKYRPEKVEMMSMFLPGLGQMYVGDFGNGLNSILLLTAVSFYAAYTATTYGLLDGALVLSSWFYRYYTGGSIKAKMAAEEKLAEEKNRVYDELIFLVEKNQIN